MKLLPALLCLSLLGCAIHPKPRPTTQPATTLPTEPKWADLDAHARTCLFSGTQLPAIAVQWRGDPHRCAGPFTVRTTYYDAAYNPVTTAAQPGRYGAI